MVIELILKEKILKGCNDVKKAFSDWLLNFNIENKFRKDNKSFMIYLKQSIFPFYINGYFERNNLIVYGDHLDKIHGFINDYNNKKIYYIEEAKLCDVKVLYNNIEYIKKGTLFTLEEKVEEVDVTKVGKKYYRNKK